MESSLKLRWHMSKHECDNQNVTYDRTMLWIAKIMAWIMLTHLIRNTIFILIMFTWKLYRTYVAISPILKKWRLREWLPVEIFSVDRIIFVKPSTEFIREFVSYLQKKHKQIYCQNIADNLRQRENVCHFADNIFRLIFLHEMAVFKTPLKFVPDYSPDSDPAMIHMMVSSRKLTLQTHICHQNSYSKHVSYVI